MKKIRVLSPLVVVSMFLFAASVQAQATRTWVSGTGADANPCSRTAPCQTFAGAFSKTAEGGEISVLDPGGFGAVTITKAITINGHNGFGHTLHTLNTSGIVVNVTTNPSTATVYLNDLMINGAQTGGDGVRYLAGANLVLDNVRIYGQAGDGIEVAGAGTLNLKINNSVIEDVAGDCIKMSTTSGQVVAMIDDSKIRNCGTSGLNAVDRVRAGVSNTTISHTVSGVRTTGTDSIFNLSRIFVSFCTTGLISNNAGVQSHIRVTDSVIAQNVTGINPNGGTIDSFDGNSLIGNPTPGTFSSTTLHQ